MPAAAGGVVVTNPKTNLLTIYNHNPIYKKNKNLDFEKYVLTHEYFFANVTLSGYEEFINQISKNLIQRNSFLKNQADKNEYNDSRYAIASFLAMTLKPDRRQYFPC